MRSLILWLLAAAATFVQAAPQPSAFPFAWRQPIVGETPSGRLCRVEVSAEIFDRCREFPADIRIRDTQDFEWPFFIWSPSRFDEMVAVRSETGSRAGGKGDGRPFILDLKIRKDARSQVPRHNQISLITTGHDFTRRVQVLGSDDGQNWEDLGRGYLVDHLQEAHVSNRIISYEENAHPLLKLFIFPSASNNRERFELIDAQVLQRTDPNAELRCIPLEPVPVPATESKDGIQTLAFLTGAQHRPIEYLRMIMEGDRFTYPVKVYGRNDATNSWRLITDGGVYRVGGQSRELIDLHGAAYRFLKIEIFHYEQKPVTVQSVLAESLPRYILFEPQSALPAFVLYGAARVPLPRYDLQFRTPPAQMTNALSLQLGEARVNPSKVALGLAAFGRSLVWLVLLVSGFLLIVFTLRRWRMGA